MGRRTLGGLFALGCALAFAAHAQTPPAPVNPNLAPLELKFDISRFVVEGNTLLPADEVKAITSRYLGRNRDFGDVQKTLEGLENAYRARGYSAVQVYLPEQELEKGVIRLQVIEARIRKVEVRNNKYFSEDNVRRSLPSVRVGESPNSDKVSANLRIANENPAKQSTVLLRAGDNQGDVDAVVDVNDEPQQKWFATLDNTGTHSTGELRAGLGYQHANLFDRDQALTLQYVTSERPSRVSIFSAGYHAPLYDLGSSIDVIAGYSDVNVGTTSTPAGPLQFSGRGTVLIGRWNYQLPRVPGYDHKLVLGLDRRHYNNTCALADFGEDACGSAGASFGVMPASLGYYGTWTLERAQAAFYVTGLRNILSGQDSSTSSLEAARFNADASYTILRFGGSFVKALKKDWQVRANLVAQYTNDALVAPEQFGAGGMNSVRGFLEREVSNDRGYTMNLELYTPDIGGALRLRDWTVRLLAFYDRAQLSRVQPQPGDTQDEAISSLGFGTRASLGKTLSLRADIAQVIEPGGTRGGSTRRLQFGALWVF